MATDPLNPVQRRVWLRDSLRALGGLCVALPACKQAEGRQPEGRPAAPSMLAAAGAAAAASPMVQQVSAPALAERVDAGEASPLASHPACAVVSRFERITDDGPRSNFTVMADGDQLQWLITSASAVAYASQLPDRIMFMLNALDRLQLGYPLSLLQHSLQAATRAKRANASDDLVLSALCHHLGMLITIEGQAELSASILRGFVSEDAFHALRHLDEYGWQHYGAQLGLPTDQRARYASEAWDPLARRLCDEWDAPSYALNYDTLPLSEFEPLVRAKFSPDNGYLVDHAPETDCLNSGSAT